MAVADWLKESVLFSVLGFNSCSTGLLPSPASASTASSTSACVSFSWGIKPVWPLEDEDAAVVVGACVLASSGLSVGLVVGTCVLASSGLSVAGVGGVGMSLELDREELSRDSGPLSEDSRSESSSSMWSYTSAPWNT